MGWRTVVVGDRDVVDMDVAVTRGATIEGELALDPGSEPPVNRTAALVVEPSLDNDWLTTAEITVTDPPGAGQVWSAARHLEIRGLAPGRYYLNTNGNDAVIQSIVSAGRDITEDPIDVSAVGPTDLKVTITTRVAAITGSVQVPLGTRPTGLAVICFPVERDAWQRVGLNPRRIRATVTDPAGTFRFEGLPAGDYLVAAVPEARLDGWRDPRFLDAAARVARPVHLNWGATVNQPLRLESIGAQ